MGFSSNLANNGKVEEAIVSTVSREIFDDYSNRKRHVGEHYQGVWYFAASIMMLCTVLLVIVRLLAGENHGKRWIGRV